MDSKIIIEVNLITEIGMTLLEPRVTKDGIRLGNKIVVNISSYRTA